MAAARAPLVGIGLCLAALAGVVVLLVRPLPWSSPRDETLPTCPAVDLRPGQGSSDVPPAAVHCLFGQTAAREGAELQVTVYTDEGDAIDVYYRRSPDHAGLVVMEDQRADRYGTGGWAVSECPEATALDALGTCTVRE